MTQATVAAAYRKKLVSNPDGEIELDTLEISHPDMSKTYYLVADQIPLTAKLETGADVTFEPSPIGIKGAGNNADMNQSATFTIPDVDNILDDEMDRIGLTSSSYPVFTFRTYLLSDLSYPAWGPVSYEVQDISQSKGLFTAAVSAPKLNNKGTGLILTPELCPLIRGILA